MQVSPRVSRCFNMLRSALIGAAVLVPALATQPAVAKDKFVFAWPSALNTGTANFTFAKALGFFDEENLDAEIIVLTGSGVIIPQLLAGTIHSAYASLEPLPISRQEGKPNFQLRFVYNFLPRSIWEMAVLEDSPIKTMGDFGGKTIGFVSLTSGNIAMTQAMAQSEGVNWNTVQKIAAGSGVPAFEALRRKSIDGLNLWDTAHVSLELTGTKIRRIPFPKEYQNLSSHGFPVTEELLKKNPGLVIRFGRAMSKAAIACNANLEGCILSFWRQYPELKPTSGSDADNMKKEVEVMKPRMANLLAGRNETNMGAFTEEDWKLLINALKVGGLIEKDANIPLNTLYTNEFVPEYNKFDRAAVISKAKAYK